MTPNGTAFSGEPGRASGATRVRWNAILPRATSQELLELLDRQPGIADDAADREGAYWIVPRNREKPNAIGHGGVLAALARDSKPRTSQAPEWPPGD